MVAASKTTTMSTKPHIAVIASPGLGHVIPLFELSKCLVKHHNLNVTFLNITTNEESASQNQLLHSPKLPQNLTVVDLHPVNVNHVTTDDMLVLHRLAVIAEESLKSLKNILIDIGNPNALVIDLFCTQAFDTCKELSIPCFTFFTASVALLTFSVYLPTLHREVEGEFIDLPEPVKVPGCKPIRTEDLLDQVRNRKIGEYKWYLYHLSRLPMGDGVFLNSWVDLEPVTIKALVEHPFYKNIPVPPVHPIGPLTKEEEPALSESDIECLRWLDEQLPESVLYVSLGSGGTLTFEQLTELAFGLEQSQQNFILVTRTPTDASASGTFFNVGSDVNDPKSYLPEGFMERTRNRGIVVASWAPQVEILKHVATGGFMSHCGWNSTLESVKHGVPMIAWPLYAEQRMNATILEEEVGVALKAVIDGGKNIVGRDEIERVIRLVMEGEEGKLMKKKARELKESGAKGLSVGGASYETLARWASQWN